MDTEQGTQAVDQRAKSKIATVQVLKDIAKTPLTIPPYQRAYRWSELQVSQMLNDLQESSSKDPTQPYLMGTLILHANDQDQTTDIVDGQQRLTTLSLFLACTGAAEQPVKSLPDHQMSNYYLEQNVKLIQQWWEQRNWTDDRKKDFLCYVLEKLTFLVVRLKSLDQAFTFFDSQNSRGKPLACEDLLKAHHLRLMTTTSEAEQKRCVSNWERIDKDRKNGSRMHRLLHLLIGRSRMYSRNEFQTLDVLTEFRSQETGTREQSGHCYRLNNYHQPPMFEKWGRTEDAEEAELELVLRDQVASLRVNSTGKLFMACSKTSLPFQMTQPLEGGEQMFWFLEKYDQLEQDLFKDKETPSNCSEFYTIRNRHKQLYGNGAQYLKDAFDAAMLFYYDKFGAMELNIAAVHFEHIFFHLRMAQNRVMHGSVVSRLLNNKIHDESGAANPFYLIDRSTSPDHLFKAMSECCNAMWRNDQADVLENICTKSGQSRYYWDLMYGLDGPYAQINKSQIGIWGLKTQIKSQVVQAIKNAELIKSTENQS